MPPPGTTAPRQPAPLAVPSWLATDWPLVGLSVIILLGIAFAFSAVYGGLLSVAVTTSFETLVDGVTAGAYLAFSAFGIKTGFAHFPASFSEGPIAVATQFLPLPWLALSVGATVVALRFAWPRLAGDRGSVLAFCAKLAITAGIVMAVLASVLSVGDDSSSRGIRAEVSGGEAWLYVTAIVAITALVYAHLRGVSVLRKPWKPQFGDIVRVALDGVRAYALLVGVMAAIAIVGSIVVVDSGGARLGVVLGTPVVGITIGVVGAAFAMGSAIGLESGHASLFHFGFPPDFDAGAAPIPFFLLLLLAPAAVAWITLRRLEAERPTSEQDVMKVAFVIGLAFAACAWVVSLVSQVNLAAGVSGGGGDDGTGIGLAARPSIAGVLGVGLLWGLAGALGAGFLWARQQGIGWQSAAAVPGPPPAYPPPPADSPPAYPPPPADSPPDSPPEPAGRQWPPPDYRPPRPGFTRPPPASPSDPTIIDACAACGSPLTPTDELCPGCGQRTR